MKEFLVRHNLAAYSKGVLFDDLVKAVESASHLKSNAPVGEEYKIEIYCLDFNSNKFDLIHKMTGEVLDNA